MDVLETQMKALAELLRERGKLSDASGSRALVKLQPLSADERVLVGDKRNVKACSQALSKALGRPVEVAFESAVPEARAVKDNFTSQVSDLFGGRIEDDL